jgi:uncharacterized Fe-S cluster protein YjdI
MTRKSYVGENVIVSFDPDVCQHSGKCVQGLPAVFEVGRSPWIVPDAASVDEVIAQVELCPSGALRIEPKESSSS